MDFPHGFRPGIGLFLIGSAQFNSRLPLSSDWVVPLGWVFIIMKRLTSAFNLLELRISGKSWDVLNPTPSRFFPFSKFFGQDPPELAQSSSQLGFHSRLRQLDGVAYLACPHFRGSKQLHG